LDVSSVSTTLSSPAVSAVLDISTRRDSRDDRTAAGCEIILALSVHREGDCGFGVARHSTRALTPILYCVVICRRISPSSVRVQRLLPRSTAGVHSSWFGLLARTWADELRFAGSIIPSHSTRVLHPLAISSNLEFRPRSRRIGSPASQIPIVEACTAHSLLHI
jgi:hypothetical protein